MWSVNDRAARDLPETSWEPATVIFRQKDQISGISSPKLSFSKTAGLEIQLLWSSVSYVSIRYVLADFLYSYLHILNKADEI